MCIPHAASPALPWCSCAAQRQATTLAAACKAVHCLSVTAPGDLLPHVYGVKGEAQAKLIAELNKKGRAPMAAMHVES
jgi:hypothetical protein